MSEVKKNMKQISSKWTFFYKYIFPFLWITGSGIIALVFLSEEGFEQQTGNLWIVLFLSGSYIVIWFSLKIKCVSLVEDGFLVSNYLREYRVSFMDVEDIKETRLWNPKLIKINLKRDYPFGGQIVFIAPYRFQPVFMNHPLVKELRDIISKKKAFNYKIEL